MVPEAQALPPAMSVEAWADLDEDTPGELVDGRLEEEEMPTALHEVVVSWLIGFLRAWAVPLGGHVFGSELKLAIRPGHGRKADVSVYVSGRALPPRSASAARRPPSIVVEVLSPRPRDHRRDRIEKLREYADFGVTWYWLVDPLARTVEIRELAPDGRHVMLVDAAEGSHAVPGCEGLVVDVDAMWAEADKLPEDEDDS